ncbi:hypothetical protein GCM10009854_09720 [Saccharopolyspora halophila]|uniref:Uncharacterized protein n=1 Tax=Saccharopolyspora halophila TaxID=405551 RepID=A0ABP5SPF9_9PSEU
MSAPTTTATECAEVWTAHDGQVHERSPEAPARTLCGLNAGTSNRVVSARACQDCVAARLESEGY